MQCPRNKGDDVSGLMKGKRGLIMGLANDRSLAWGIAKALHVSTDYLLGLKSEP